MNQVPACGLWMRLLNNFLRKKIIVYLDDILIFSKSLDENLLYIFSVLDRLREDKLLNKLKKCSFVKRELVYLWFVVCAEGLKMDLEKVKVILEWTTPRSTNKVRSLHGVASFYRAFIRNLSSICAPLTEIMRVDRKLFRETTRAIRSLNCWRRRW